MESDSTAQRLEAEGCGALMRPSESGQQPLELQSSTHAHPQQCEVINPMVEPPSSAHQPIYITRVEFGSGSSTAPSMPSDSSDPQPTQAQSYDSVPSSTTHSFHTQFIEYTGNSKLTRKRPASVAPENHNATFQRGSARTTPGGSLRTEVRAQSRDCVSSPMIDSFCTQGAGDTSELAQRGHTSVFQISSGLDPAQPSWMVSGGSRQTEAQGYNSMPSSMVESFHAWGTRFNSNFSQQRPTSVASEDYDSGYTFQRESGPARMEPIQQQDPSSILSHSENSRYIPQRGSVQSRSPTNTIHDVPTSCGGLQRTQLEPCGSASSSLSTTHGPPHTQVHYYPRPSMSAQRTTPPELAEFDNLQHPETNGSGSPPWNWPDKEQELRTQRYHKLKAHNRILRGQVDSLQEERKGSNAERKRMAAKIVRLETDISELLQILGKKEGRISFFTKEFGIARSLRLNLHDANRRLTEELDEMRAKSADIEARLREETKSEYKIRYRNAIYKAQKQNANAGSPNHTLPMASTEHTETDSEQEAIDQWVVALLERYRGEGGVLHECDSGIVAPECHPTVHKAAMPTEAEWNKFFDMYE